MGALRVPVAVVEENWSDLVPEKLSNTGAGHHPPTYFTPKIFVRVRMLDSELRVIGGTTMTQGNRVGDTLGQKTRSV